MTKPLDKKKITKPVAKAVPKPVAKVVPKPVAKAIPNTPHEHEHF